MPTTTDSPRSAQPSLKCHRAELVEAEMRRDCANSAENAVGAAKQVLIEARPRLEDQGTKAATIVAGLQEASAAWRSKTASSAAELSERLEALPREIATCRESLGKQRDELEARQAQRMDALASLISAALADAGRQLHAPTNDAALPVPGTAPHGRSSLKI